MGANDGAEINAMLGPPWWWSENSISLQPGDHIQLEGFESTAEAEASASAHMEVNWLTNHTTGQTITLRDANGTPVWAGNE